MQHHRIMRALATLVALVAVSGCKGDAGPAGPPGPQGPAGPPGPVGPSGASNRYVLSGIFGASGTASGTLPSSAVTGNALPAIACYISSTGETWLAVAQTPPLSSDTFCGLTGIGTSTPSLTIINGPPGWRYYLIAVY